MVSHCGLTFAMLSLMLQSAAISGKSFRLPNSSIPVHYDLRLETDIDQGNLDYSGQVTITIQMLETTNQLILHSDVGEDLSIQLYKLSGETIHLEKYELEEDTQFLLITTARQLERSEQLQLAIRFNSTLREDRTGFFIDYYEDGESSVFYAMTHFEPSFARTAFPCYDEPGLKASFDVEVVCGTNYKVHSNAELSLELRLSGNRKVVQFEQTPPMQSYLLAVLVSNFEENARNYGGVRVGMLTFPSVEEQQLEFAFDISGRALEALQEYGGQDYSFPKLEQVGIDSFPGAMENWGLILYSDEFLIVDPDESTDVDKFESALIVTHEIAHQFFGNLVGPSWWTYLWLNEGFATFISEKLMSQFLPELASVTNSRYAGDTWRALNYDSQLFSLPMSHYVEQPHEIRSLFDVYSQGMIVYTKAARVIQMMEYAIGAHNFRIGIQDYLATHKYGSVDTSDLYRSLSEAVANTSMIPEETSFAQIFDSWATQAGHPIVYVEPIGDSNRYRFTQKRYKECPCQSASWWIPIFYDSFGMNDTWLGESLAFWVPAGKEPVIQQMDDLPLVNTRSYGFYRVNYWPAGWEHIVDRWETIPADSRAKLLDDAFGLVKEQEMEATLLTSMLVELTYDTDAVPWLAAMADHNIGYIIRVARAATAEDRESIETFVKLLISRMVDIFLHDPSPKHEEVSELAKKWANRFDIAVPVDSSAKSRSMRNFDICQRLLSAEYMQSLRGNLRSLQVLIKTIEQQNCFNEETVDIFMENLFGTNKWQEVFDVLEAFVEYASPYLGLILERLMDNVLNVYGNPLLEKFLVRLSLYIFDPFEQQLMVVLIERSAWISDEGRFLIEERLRIQLDQAKLTVTSMVSGIERYIDGKQIHRIIVT